MNRFLYSQLVIKYLTAIHGPQVLVKRLVDVLLTDFPLLGPLLKDYPLCYDGTSDVGGVNHHGNEMQNACGYLNMCEKIFPDHDF